MIYEPPVSPAIRDKLGGETGGGSDSSCSKSVSHALLVVVRGPSADPYLNKPPPRPTRGVEPVVPPRKNLTAPFTKCARGRHDDAPPGQEPRKRDKHGSTDPVISITTPDTARAGGATREYRAPTQRPCQILIRARAGTTLFPLKKLHDNAWVAVVKTTVTACQDGGPTATVHSVHAPEELAG